MSFSCSDVWLFWGGVCVSLNLRNSVETAISFLLMENSHLCLVEWQEETKSSFFMTLILPFNHKKLMIEILNWSRILYYWGDPHYMWWKKEVWSLQRVALGTNFFTCQYTLLLFLWVSWLSPSWETSINRAVSGSDIFTSPCLLSSHFRPQTV